MFISDLFKTQIAEQELPPMPDPTKLIPGRAVPKSLGPVDPEEEERRQEKIDTFKRLSVPAAGAAAGAALQKGASMVIPGIGSALGAEEAYQRYKAKDYPGAAIAGVGAVTGMVPGPVGYVGPAASAAINLARDEQRARQELYKQAGLEMPPLSKDYKMFSKKQREQGKLKEMAVRPPNPSDYDSDQDYAQAMQSYRVKMRTRPEEEPSVSTEPEVPAYPGTQLKDYTVPDMEQANGKTSNGERYNLIVTFTNSDPNKAKFAAKKYADFHWGSKKVQDTKIDKTEDNLYTVKLFVLDRHQQGFEKPFKDQALNEQDNDLEVWGYMYNRQDQREFWRKIFSTEDQARLWAAKRNATILGITPIEKKKQVDEEAQTDLELSDNDLTQYIKKASELYDKDNKDSAKTWSTEWQELFFKDSLINPASDKKHHLELMTKANAWLKSKNIPISLSYIKFNSEDPDQLYFGVDKRQSIDEMVDNFNSKKVHSLLALIYDRLDEVEPEAVKNYGHEVVGDAILNVAKFHKDLDTVDSTDVSLMVQEVLSLLKSSRNKVVEIAESKIYFNVLATSEYELKKEFGLSKDRKGWYLKENSDPKKKLDVMRAFNILKS